ncbi:MAG TPA: tetratricopeptide repeat protein [Streptosporangiaceae bacterium]
MTPAGRADAEPRATAALAAQCARLPLALRVAAELVAARPADRLCDLAGELAGQHRRLDLLDVYGDPRTAVRAVFSWSYLHLDAGAARAFRLLGLHPGADFEHYAAAALTGTILEQADRLLTALARAHLIHPAGPAGPGRHGMHDLLRAYAAERAVDHDAEPDRRQALTRNQTGQAHALGNLGRVDLRQGRYQQASDHLWQALALFRQAGYLADEAEALTSLGAVELHQGGYQQAASRHRQALAIFREIGDRSGEADARNGLGRVFLATAQADQARTEYGTALALADQIGDTYQQAHAHDGLARAYHAAGHPAEARRHWRQALTLFTDLGAPEVTQVRAELATAEDLT